MQVKLIFITFNVNCSFCQKAVKTYVKFLVIKFVLNRIQADFQFSTHTNCLLACSQWTWVQDWHGMGRWAVSPGAMWKTRTADCSGETSSSSSSSSSSSIRSSSSSTWICCKKRSTKVHEMMVDTPCENFIIIGLLVYRLQGFDFCHWGLKVLFLLQKFQFLEGLTHKYRVTLFWPPKCTFLRGTRFELLLVIQTWHMKTI